MAKSLSSKIKLMDDALSCTSSPFALSYAGSDQKWLIRQHLISLLQEFPSLNPSVDEYNHNDGRTVFLLKAKGDLRVSASTPVVPLTIWLHENYPFMAPIVYVTSPSNAAHPIQSNHPFVDPSGSTTSAYLQNWQYPRCNLLDLVHNLVKLFSLNHPFCYSPSSSSYGYAHPSLASKMEAMDRLTCALYYDVVALNSKTEEEIEEWSNLQAEMQSRVDVAENTIIGLDHEWTGLKKRVRALTEDADVLLNWLKVHDKSSLDAMFANNNIDDAFVVADEILLGCLAANEAVDELIHLLDQAVNDGVVSFDVYIKQVRNLAREQFHYRAKLIQKGAF